MENAFKNGMNMAVWPIGPPVDPLSSSVDRFTDFRVKTDEELGDQPVEPAQHMDQPDFPN